MSANHQHSLAELQQALTQWRSHRRGGSIPVWIRTQVVGLLAHHRASEIKAVLRLNHEMLKQWQAQYTGPSDPPPATLPSEFVTLPSLTSDPCEEPQETVLSLTLSRQASDGSTVSIAGSLSWGQWHQALRLLSAGEASR
jgi:hypothetical protein